MSLGIRPSIRMANQPMDVVELFIASFASQKESFQMGKQPNLNGSIILLSLGDRENQVNQIAILIVQRNAVQFQKNKHGVRADSFVSVEKRMIHDQPIAQSGSFGRDAWLEILALERLERNRKGRLQHGFVT